MHLLSVAILNLTNVNFVLFLNCNESEEDGMEMSWSTHSLKSRMKVTWIFSGKKLQSWVVFDMKIFNCLWELSLNQFRVLLHPWRKDLLFTNTFISRRNPFPCCIESASQGKSLKQLVIFMPRTLFFKRDSTLKISFWRTKWNCVSLISELVPGKSLLLHVSISQETNSFFSFFCSDSESQLKEELSYFSPELIRSIELSNNQLILKNAFSPETDAYAFGTILYELVAYKLPFEKLSIDSIIWRVGSGDHEPLHKINCSSSFKELISRCWHSNPARRLKFPAVVRLLQENVSIHKTFSCSEPEKLNCAGLGLGLTFMKSKLIKSWIKQIITCFV